MMENPTSHEPELVLNNFTTRVGHRIGRRVVTFHNQRDFIFFRHHRYIFETKESKQSNSKGKKAKDTKGESISNRSSSGVWSSVYTKVGKTPAWNI